MKTWLRLMVALGIALLCGRALPARQATDVNGVPVVVNEPYSAVEQAETTQTLSNGSHIDRKTITKVWRDSQGRTRSEHYLKPLRASAGPEILVSVAIRDPVAGYEYLLNPREHNGEQFPLHPMKETEPNAGAGGRSLNVATGGGASGPSSFSTVNLKREDLGAQTMDGISADGTRTTRTVPAEAMGNDEPFQIVKETWYSKELGIPLEVKVSDPRAGDRTMQVTEINRAEPDPSLFQPPTDYTITQHK
ncbi:MAG TPA: hypothetical protein VMH00_01625 [Candidatus Limnocylindrales bacterium]|nr:hypothetical protein [Candidatus Limnocylindrales bacterium]